MKGKENKAIKLNIIICSILTFMSCIKVGAIYSIIILIICFSTLKIYEGQKLKVFKIFGAIASIIFVVNLILSLNIVGSTILPLLVIGSVIVYQLVISIPIRIRNKKVNNNNNNRNKKNKKNSKWII